MASSLYFDHHATTPLAPAVLAEMLPWLSERVGNAASRSHAAGQAAARAVDEARGRLAESLCCEPEEIIFTSGATEANNLALKGLFQGADRTSHLIVNAAEHRAVLDPARRLQRTGYAVTVLPVECDGTVTPESVREALRPNTRVVSVMAANNEVGALNDLRALGEICRERGVLLHTDAAQAVGHVPFDCGAVPVDLVSITAHKLNGPQGIGALVVRRNRGRIPLEPLFEGGGHERGLRSGTLPVALIVGFAAAAHLAMQNLRDEMQRLSQLREELWTRLRARLPDLQINGPIASRLPGNLNVTVPGVDGEALLARLQQTELAVSSGAACSSNNPEPSHVLRAIGLSDAAARASLRFGLGIGNDLAQVESAVEIISNTVTALRSGR